MTKSVYQSMLDSVLTDPELKAEHDREVAMYLGVSDLLNQLEELRVSAGMTKADLARAAGMQPSNLRKLLSTGEKNFEIGTLVKLANALGASLNLITSTTRLGPGVRQSSETTPAPLSKQKGRSQFVAA